MGWWTTAGEVVLFLAGAVAVSAQEPAAGRAASQAHVDVSVVAARTEDVSSLDAIVKAYYDVVSGPAGAPRQWARDRTLYIPGVHLVSIKVRPGETQPEAHVMDHQQYVDGSDGPMVRDGFYEREIHRVVRRFGDLAHVLSTYEAQQTPDGAVLERGVNSLDLYFDGKRWWIAAASWDVERPGHSIPAAFAWTGECPPPEAPRKAAPPKQRPKRAKSLYPKKPKV